MAANGAGAGGNDRIDDTLDYKAVSKRLKKFVS